jgi:hypothetical protein
MKRSLPNYETITGGLEPSKVKADPFLGEAFMTRVPDDIIKRVEGCSTPWLELSGGENLLPEEKRFFEVARSAALANTQRVFEALGLATRKASKPSRMYEGERLLRRLLDAGFFKSGLERQKLLDSADKKGRSEIEKVFKEVSKSRAGAGCNDTNLEGADDAILHFKEQNFLITTWLRWGEDGCPGLCFYKLDDIVTVMKTVFPRIQSKDPYKRYGKKMIERLGLKLFNRKRPLILDVDPKPGGYIQVRYQGFRPFRIDRKSKEGKKTDKHLLPPLELFGEAIYPASE